MSEIEFQRVALRNEYPEKGEETHAHNAAHIVKDDRSRVVDKFGLFLSAMIGPEDDVPLSGISNVFGVGNGDGDALEIGDGERTGCVEAESLDAGWVDSS